MVSKSFFPDLQGQGARTDDAADGTTALVAGFMPLLPSSSLAVCRALLHIVHPRVLLAGFGPEQEPSEGRPPVIVAESGRELENVDSGGTTVEGGATRQGCLMLGPIFSVILRHGGASSGLSLRFLALQVRGGQRFFVVGAYDDGSVDTFCQKAPFSSKQPNVIQPRTIVAILRVKVSTF